MIQATKTWYDDTGARQTGPVQIHSADDAFTMAHHVFKKRDEAYCVTLDRWRNGAFVARVMTKEKMIFKIEHHVS